MPEFFNNLPVRSSHADAWFPPVTCKSESQTHENEQEAQGFPYLERFLPGEGM